ncbi:MAG: von Willebrand factor type A domain-containing protein [Verrucomicrobiota bacterium]
MKLNTYEDDPRVTAYVFGELDTAEASAFEQEMERKPELKELVQEFRAGVEMLEEVVSSETASDFSLDPERRKFLDEAIRAEQRRESKVGWWKNPWRMTSVSFATACLLIGICFLFWHDSVVIEDAGPRRDLSSALSMKSSDGEIMVSTDMADTQPPLMESYELPSLKGDLSEAGGEVTALGEVEIKTGESWVAANESYPAPATPMRRELGLQPAAEPVAGVKAKKAVERTDQLSVASVTTAPRPAYQSQRVYGRGLEQRKRTSGKPESLVTLSGYVEGDRFAFPADPGAEGYAEIVEKGFVRIVDAETGTSTFSADVDTAAYANIRRYLNSGQLPPVDAVRIEEMINYFSYNYAEPEGKHPFTSDVVVASCPWQPKHRLARIGIKAESVDADEREPMNLVFLIDVSGSMSSQNKLPLLKRAMKLMVNNLNQADRVAMVTYAGSSGLVLDSTPVSDRHKILSALDRLKSGGSTAGAAGIELAYRVAQENLIDEGQNRVILCTDGDFNVGVINNSDLTDLIRRGGKEGIFLNIFGFGMGNIKDDRLEQLSNDGNGTYGYIDSFQEAQKVFSEQLQGTLATVAKDVKFQLEFNPSQVAAYRLIGYENRMLAREDFNDDTKDAGEVGAGHTVTALYEIVPVGVEGTIPEVGEHRYIQAESTKDKSRNPKLDSDELFYLKIRYKEPDASKSQLLTFPVKDDDQSDTESGGDFQFAAAVAQAGQLLRGSKYAGKADWETVLKLARAGRGEDPHGYRAEFIRLSEVARDLQKN